MGVEGVILVEVTKVVSEVVVLMIIVTVVLWCW